MLPDLSRVPLWEKDVTEPLLVLVLLVNALAVLLLALRRPAHPASPDINIDLHQSMPLLGGDDPPSECWQHADPDDDEDD